MTTLLRRAVLLLYPRAFRRRHGAEVLEAMEEQAADPAYAGARGRLRYWRDILDDAVRAAWRLRTSRDGSTASLPARAANIHPFPTSPAGLELLMNDLRHAVRALVRRPGFTAAAVLILGIGIGGTSLIAGLVDGLVLRPFHYPDPDRLVTIGVTFPKMNADESFIEVLSPPEYLDISQAKSLEHVLAFDLGNRNLSGGDLPERVFTALVFGDPFQTIRMRPVLGRGFTREELSPGGGRVAIISYRLWQSRFGGDPGIVGRAIRINGIPTDVVGVMPPGLLLIGTDLWLPLTRDPRDWPREGRHFNVLARLADGASREQANAELAAIADRIAADYAARYPEYAGWRLSAVPWAEALTRPLRPAAALLALAVAFVLLIVCANVASLQIARLLGRRRELSIRVALGAGRLRLARELLIENLVLGLAGGAFGIAVAWAGLRVAVTYLPERVRMLDPDVGFDTNVLLMALAVSVAAAMLVGLIPALVAPRLGSSDALKAGTHHVSPASGAASLRQALVGLEVALALVLLVGAGLMARTMWQLAKIDPGVDTSHVLTMRLTLPREKYEGAAITAFFDRVLERLESSPGIAGAATASQYAPNVFFGTPVVVDSTGEGSSMPTSYVTVATPNLFRVLGIPIVKGRALTPADRQGTEPVAVVNESFARRFYGGLDAIGRRVGLPSGEGRTRWLQVVGVAADTRGRGMAEAPAPELYVPMDQDAGAWNQLFLLVRVEGAPHAYIPTVRRIVSELDPDQPVYAITTLEEAFSASVVQQQASAILLWAFAAIAVLLAGVGVYTVSAYVVGQRRQEIGIQMALGARDGDVVRLVLRQLAWILIAGMAVGLLGGLALGRVARGILVRTPPDDPLTIGAVTLLLAAIALAAGYLPARRATRIDPVAALRTE